MGLTFAENTRPLCRNCRNLPFPAALLFAVLLASCNNTCFTFTSNPPNGTITVKASDLKPTCRLATVNGAVRIQMGTEPACSSCSKSSQIQHIFVTIRGIAIHPSTTGDDDSPDWLELLPSEFAKRPLQVDLIKGATDRIAREPWGEIMAIPAGIYRQVRLRFASNQLPTDDQLPEKNACGNGVFNCVVMADGRSQPLQIGGGSPEVRITSDRIEGASLFIPPDTDTNLVIELKLVWAWFFSADEGMRFLPVLTGNAKAGRVELDGLGTPENGVVHDSLLSARVKYRGAHGENLGRVETQGESN